MEKLKYYFCTHCDYNCRTNSEIDTHVTKDHSFTCKICEYIFKTDEEFEKHLVSVHTVAVLDLKNGMTVRKINMEDDVTVGFNTFKHHRSTKTIRYFFCNFCEFKCSSQSEMDEHAISHTGRITCEVCSSSLTNINSYCTHFERYHRTDLSNVHRPELYNIPLKPASTLCFICGKTYLTYDSMRQHIGFHSRLRRKLICEICGIIIDSLGVHMRMHTGEKPHKCSYCDKSFRKYNNLQNHIRIHTKDKRYKCLVCDKRFTQWCGLNFHMRTHTNEKPFKCALCEKAFAHKSSLTGHLTSHERKIAKEKESSKTKKIKKNAKEN